MNFKAATDSLFDRVTHDDLAAELGASVPAIRQARIDPQSEGFRYPPHDWERAVKTLCEARIKHFQRLLGQLGK